MSALSGSEFGNFSIHVMCFLSSCNGIYLNFIIRLCSRSLSSEVQCTAQDTHKTHTFNASMSWKILWRTMTNVHIVLCLQSGCCIIVIIIIIINNSSSSKNSSCDSSDSDGHGGGDGGFSTNGRIWCITTSYILHFYWIFQRCNYCRFSTAAYFYLLFCLPQFFLVICIFHSVCASVWVWDFMCICTRERNKFALVSSRF